MAVAPDVDDVAVMENSIDQSGGHDFVTEDLAPFLEALVGGEHGRSMFVAPTHELEEEHRAGSSDREVPDFIDDQERGMSEGPKSLTKDHAAPVRQLQIYFKRYQCRRLAQLLVI